MFSASQFETDILGGTCLPRDAEGHELIRGTPRSTPYGLLFNVSVYPVNAEGLVTKRRIPDDATYARYPVLYDLVPRICVVGVDADGCYYKAAFALPKFNALTPVDDDDREESEGGEGNELLVTSLRVPGVVAYQAQEKANGHTVVYRLLPDDILLAGTKGCAWLCKLTDGALLDTTLSACAAPTEMVEDAFRCMRDLLRADPVGVMDVLRTGRVRVGERETNQHIRFYAPPEVGVVGVMFFDTDLPPVFKRPETRGPFAVEDLTPALLHGLRGGGNSEGWVLCGLDVDGNVLIRFKLKTVAYTCLRTARAAYDPLDGLQCTLHKWHTRIHDRNQFLHVHPRYLDEVVFAGFLLPLLKYMYANGVTRQDIAFSSTGFAPVIEAFRVESKCSDDFHLPSPCTNKDLLQYGAKKAAYSAAQRAKSGGMLVITAAMPPGSGKSTFMALAATAVPGAVHMSQDQFSPHAEKFYDALLGHLEAGLTVFLHRCCFNGKDRRRVLGLAARAHAQVVIIQASDSTPSQQLYTALRGVLLRDTHETLGVGVSDVTRALVAGSFWCQCTPIDIRAELSGSAKAVVIPIQLHELDVSLPVDLQEEVAAFGREVRARKPFDTKQPLSDAAVYTALFARIRAGPELRKPAEEVAAEVVSSYRQWCQNITATPSCVLYASIDLEPADTLQILAACVPRGVPAMATSANHVTLVYQPSLKQADVLSRLLGLKVRVRITRVVSAADGGIVACDADIVDTGGELNAHYPAHPHVTVAWICSLYKPVDSVRLFNGSLPDAISTAFALDVVGTVAFHYGK